MCAFLPNTLCCCCCSAAVLSAIAVCGLICELSDPRALSLVLEHARSWRPYPESVCPKGRKVEDDGKHTHTHTFGVCMNVRTQKAHYSDSGVCVSYTFPLISTNIDIIISQKQ
jgi:hypothetical protein